MPAIVQVTWIDAAVSIGWRSETTAPSVNHTVGFLVYTDDDYMEVACTYAPDSEMWNASISIPQDNVVTYRVIHEAAQEEMTIVFEPD